MEAAGQREELNCSICSNPYTEPISLTCGHNFCRDCSMAKLDAQEKSGGYFCPECRGQYTERPQLEKNTRLEAEVFCTYCDGHVPATKTCLHCEASFCGKHLKNHSKSTDHILTDPTTSFEGRKCSTHDEILKYYCPEDGSCICMSCWVAGDHKGHQVELLNVASEKLKENLREMTKRWALASQEIEIRIQDLDNHRTQETQKTVAVTRKVTELFKEIRKQMNDVEKRIIVETYRQKKQISQSVFNRVQQLEKQKDELPNRINQLEELCKIQDPLTFLKMVSIREDMCLDIDDTSHDVGDAGCLSEDIISQILQKGLSNLTTSLRDLIAKRQLPVMKISSIFLDINTAHDNLILSRKRKRATHTDNAVTRRDGPKRFKSRQVVSINKFRSGTHYWEVDVSEAEEWLIGVVAQSIERKINGQSSFIGYNDKSWGLIQKTGHSLQARHSDNVTSIDSKAALKTVGIHLDYEGGRLSFYQLCDPIRHLHTFPTTFTEPLHAAFYVFPKSSIRIIS